ncbi:MAG: hypothetical protein ACRDP1_08295 [Nocardioidaceae bacterium]
MTEPIEKDRLEDVVRPEETPDDLVLLLRAGDEDDSVERLKHQAARLSRRYTLNGADCYGVSAFAATEENESWLLATKMYVRRRYYRIASADVAGLTLLPTFTAPHWTVLFPGPDGPAYQAFLDALGDLRDNPYWNRKVGRRPR